MRLSSITKKMMKIVKFCVAFGNRKDGLLVTFFLMCLAASSLAQKVDEKLLTPIEMKNISIKVTAIRMAYEQLLRTNDLLSRDSLDILEKETLMNIYSSLDINAERAIGCVESPDSTPWTNFKVYICWRKFVFHHFYYVVAIGYDGSLFFLQGFEANDFEKLIKAKLGKVQSKQDAERVAKLYLNTVWLSGQAIELVDSSNIGVVKAKFSGVSVPKTVKKGNSFKVALCTIPKEENQNERTERFTLHKFIVSSTGKIKHDYKLMK